jgi:hypothetical protein
MRRLWERDLLDGNFVRSNKTNSTFASFAVLDTPQLAEP